MTDELASRRARRRAARWKRPRRILSLWARYALLGSVIAVSVFLAVCLVAKVAKPYREAGGQQVQLAAIQQQSGALAAQNVQLERRIAYLKTPGGVASEARRMSYLYPGEYPIVVEGLKPPADSGIPQAETMPSVTASPEHSPSNAGPNDINPMRRFWRHLSGR